MSENRKDYYENYISATKIDLDKIGSFKEMKTFINNHFMSNDVSILDIGCGIGYLTSYLNQCGKAVGIDINKEALKCARAIYHGVDFILADIINNNDLKIDKKFDCIICNNIVEHLTEEERIILFDKINNNYLKDNGIIIFGYANPYHPVQLLWGYITKKVLFDKTHVFNWNIKEFQKVINGSFDIINSKKTSPFTKMVWIGKHFKGDILVFARKKI